MIRINGLGDISKKLKNQIKIKILSMDMDLFIKVKISQIK
jgi:hypothetical protein